MSGHKTWREPSEAEFPHGIAALAKIIGDEASVRPVWTRRLALTEDGTTWLLTISSGGKPRIESFAPWADPEQLRVYQTAYPLAEAVEILQGPNNPEEILAERRRRVAEHEAEEAKAQALAKAQQAAKDADTARLEEDKRKFGFDHWVRLDPWVQAFFALAVRVKDRDPALAADLRAIAHEARRIHPNQPAFPRAVWER
jgi:hypothetical protein